MNKSGIPLYFTIGFPDGKIIDFLECEDRFFEMEHQVEEGSEEEWRLKNNLRATGNLE